MIDIKNWGNTVKFYDQPETKGIRALFYGVAGSGKTHLIGTVPTDQLFMMDIDHGGETISGLHVPYITIPQERGLMGLVRKALLDFKDRQGKFAKGGEWEGRRILGFDGYSNLVDLVLWEICQVPGSEKSSSKSDGEGASRFREFTGMYKPEMDHWGALRVYLFEITQILEDISYRGYDVLATAGEFVKQNDDQKQTQGLPEVQGGFKDVIGRKFDYVIRLKIKDGRYLAMTKPDGLYIAKVRKPLPAEIENPTYDKLFKKAGS